MINPKTSFKKIVVIGDAAVGKTLLVTQICKKELPASKTYRATIGADFMVVETGQATYRIWDTAGQDRFNSLSAAIFRGTDLFLLVFNVHWKPSFEHLEWHLKKATENRGSQDALLQFLLVGTTDRFFGGDPKAARAVSVEEAEEFAHLHRCMYLEATVASAFNREEVMQKLAEQFAKMEI